MSKYYVFKACYEKVPECRMNFRKALECIGKRDPHNIRKTTLCGRKHKPGEQLSDQQYFGRGVLTVRKNLNHKLGKSGKYTNQMIKACAKAELIEDIGAGGMLKVRLPYKDLKKIVETTYTILKECNQDCCKNLLKREKKDCYLMQEDCKNKQFKAVAPIPANMLIRTFEAKTKELTEFCAEFREEMKKEG